MNLRQQLREAMNNAMCGDFCFDMHCQRCEAARLQAICDVVDLWLAGILKPLNPLVQAGFIPRETVRELQTTMKELKRDPHT